MSVKIERISIDSTLDQVVSVRELELASGKRRYSVYARIAGKQHRKRTKTKEEATTYAWSLYDDYTLESCTRRRLPTTLGPEQVADAEKAYRSLSAAENLKHYTLDEAIRRLKELQPATIPLPLEVAKTEFLKSRKNANLHKKDYADYERTFARLERVCGDKDLHLYEPSDVSAYLADLNQSLAKRRRLTIDPEAAPIYTDATYNKHVGRLATFFTFCGNYFPNRIQPKVHPCKTFKQRKVSHEDIRTLSPDEAQRLMDLAENFAGGALVTYFAFNLFLPIRADTSGESGRLAASLETLKLLDDQKGELKVPGHDAKGRRRKRTIPYTPPFRRYQEMYPINEYPIIPKLGVNCPERRLKNALERFRTLYRRETGHRLGHNICRRSCITYDLAFTGSYAETARKAGTSEEVIKSNYEGEADRETAIAYRAIAPIGHPDRDQSLISEDSL